MIDFDALWRLKDSLVQPQTKQTRFSATYSHTDQNGVPWVKVAGSEELSPVTGSLSATMEQGQTVELETRDGTLYVAGNSSDPSQGSLAARAARGALNEGIRTAKVAAAMADSVAKQAKRVADAINQHFWTDGSGVHVTEVGQADFEETPTGRNILMNAYGFLLREAETWLASFTEGATAFYDGLGNEAANIITSVGKAGATIGYVTGRHVTVNDDGMTVYSQDGVDVFDISAIGAPHTEQVLYQIKEIEGYAKGTSSVSGLDTQSPTRQQESGARKLVGWWDGSDYPGFNWNRPLKLRVIVTVSAVGLDANGNTITADEQLLDDVLDVSIGNSTVSIGDGSILLEYTGNAFFLHQLYATVTGAYLQDESGFVSYNATTTLKVVSGGYVASGSVLRPTMRFGSSSLDGPSGPYSVALGWRALAQAEAQAAFGRFNANDPANAFEVGNGTADDARSNAYAVGWDGTIETARDLDTTTWTDVLSSKSSDINITGFKYVQRGQVVSLWIRFQRTTATSAGAAITVGTLSTAYRPLVEAAAPAPAGAGDAYALESGSVMYRPQSQLAANTNAYVRVTYLVA